MAAHEIEVLDLTSSSDRDTYNRLKSSGCVLKEQDFFGIGSSKEEGAYPIIQRVVDYRPKSAIEAAYSPPIC
jgi:hypothetical protein